MNSQLTPTLSLSAFVSAPVLSRGQHSFLGRVSTVTSRSPRAGHVTNGASRASIRREPKMTVSESSRIVAPIPVESKGQYQVPQGSTFWDFNVDREGNELPVPGTKDTYVLPRLKQLVKENAYSDIFIVSHGWNSTPHAGGSTDFSHDMIRGLHATNPNKSSGNSLYIGITWPSLPIKSLFVGKKGVRTDYHAKNIEYRKLLANDPVKYWKDVQESLESKGEQSAGGALGEVIKYFDAPGLTKDSALASEAISKISDLGEILGAGKNLVEAIVSPSEVPDDDPEDPPENEKRQFRIRIPVIARTVQLVKELAEHFGYLPLVAAAEHAIFLSRALEYVLFETFERRAAIIGANGVSQLVWEMMNESASHKTKVHLIGHSLGCHVMSCAALSGSPDFGDPNLVYPRKLHSVTLLQGAIPQMAFQGKGVYRNLTEGFPIVAGPVLGTTSRHDLALQTYELFKGKPLGRAGFPELGERTIVVEIPEGLKGPIGFQNGMYYTLVADPVINGQSRWLLDVTGAHVDIYDPEIMCCIWEAATTVVQDHEYSIVRN